jgi:putative acetyltransferase
MWHVRPERPQDFDAIRRLHDRAFAPSAVEARLVDALREDGAHVPPLCLVATQDDDVVGHVFFSRARLDSGHEVLALAPMGVLPEHQRAGVGSALAAEALTRAAATAFPAVVVLGHPEYYPRFGFEPATALGITAPFDVPDEAWMAIPLPGHTPEARGRLTYPEAFGAL